MSNLLDRSSLVLTPTAYNNGEALCIKPDDASGDFTFSRNSAATRVNAQGLVENVQILSSNLVQNGSFSEEGVQEVSNGSFSQEGVELVTNGDFATDTDWTKQTGWSISNGKAIANSSNGSIYQPINFIDGKSYKITFDITEYTSGEVACRFNDDETNTFNSVGSHTLYFVSNNSFDYVYFKGLNSFIGSIDNCSVREVGQDWTLGDGWSIGEDKAVAVSGASSRLEQSISGLSGKTCKVSFTLSDYGGGGAVYVDFGSVNSDLINTNGEHVVYGTFDQDNFELFKGAAFSGSITNISVKEVGQNWDLGDGWSIAENKVVSDGTINKDINQVSVTTSGKTYKYSFDVLDVASGVLDARFRNGSGGSIVNFSSEGTYTGTFVAYGGRASFVTLSGNTASYSITNISVIEITDDTNLPRINYEGFSYQDALGSEQIVNGSFDSDTAWTKGAGWSIANGFASHNASLGAGDLYQDLNLTVSKSYKITIEITATDATELYFMTDSGNYVEVSGSPIGKHSYVFVATNSLQSVGVRGSGNWDGSIDNVSVKEYLGQSVVPGSGCGSWLFEPASTNLIPYSEDFSSLNIRNNAVVTSNQIISPSGLLDADEITFDGTFSGRVEASVSTIVGQPYTISLYLKNKDLSDVTQVWIGFSVVSQGQFVTITDEWQRYDITTNADGTTEYPRIQFGGTGSLYAWGFQTEQQSYATSYIPNFGEANGVSRNQDLCTNGGSLASINSTEGTLYFEGSPLALENSQKWIALSDGTHNNTIKIGILNSATNYKIAADVRVGGVNQAFLAYDFGAVAPTFKKCAIKYKQNDFELWIDGVEVATDTSGNTPIGLSELNFTRGNDAQNFFGKTKAVAVWKEALSDQELTELTTI